MAELFENEQPAERVILVGVKAGPKDPVEASLDELAELAGTAGAVCVGRLIQSREGMHPGTYIGKGKLEELRELILELAADAVICDDELSPAQMANMADALETKVLDRTVLILDIFAGRASTREGRLQVELAQLRYRATRLVGMRASLSRLGGGIGTRGPGEKKLEIDRRLIRDRISQLRRELEDVETHRAVARQSRKRNEIPVAAIVGYTNAGKSTLLNVLTDAGVLEEDKLFATLDPTTRNLTLESGQQVLLTDTVGFIHKLPHHLVESFKSTLEEARYADLLIHVVDASDPQMAMHMYVVYQTLEELGVENKTVITCFNKIDLLPPDADLSGLRDMRADVSLLTAFRQGQGTEPLMAALEEELRAGQLLIERTFGYEKAGAIAVIRKYGQLLAEEYRADGIYVKAYVPKEIYARIEF